MDRGAETPGHKESDSDSGVMNNRLSVMDTSKSSEIWLLINSFKCTTVTPLNLTSCGAGIPFGEEAQIVRISSGEVINL